jgi:uncharacterized membrane protein YvbJ
MFCEHCGKIVSDNALFCKYCGYQFEDEITSTSEKMLPKSFNLKNRAKHRLSSKIKQTRTIKIQAGIIYFLFSFL